MALCKLLRHKRAGGNAVGSRAGIWVDHLMFLSMWHLFRLQLGKVTSVTDWPRECGDRQGKVDYLGFLPPVMSGMDFGELFLVDDRVRGKKV